MKELFKLSQGNPGALTCLMGIMKLDQPEEIYNGITIIATLQELNITGTDVYILWNDLSNKDYSVMAHLCESCPPDILKEASARQDYSGLELIKEYIKK